MRRIVIVTLAVLSVAACAERDRPEQAVPSGAFRPLNASRWSWNGNEIAVPPPGAAEATGLVRRVSR